LWAAIGPERTRAAPLGSTVVEPIPDSPRRLAPSARAWSRMGQKCPKRLRLPAGKVPTSTWAESCQERTFAGPRSWPSGRSVTSLFSEGKLPRFLLVGPRSGPSGYEGPGTSFSPRIRFAIRRSIVRVPREPRRAARALGSLRIEKEYPWPPSDGKAPGRVFSSLCK
jgi:hypothetical protein